jgi:KUP system potassium uptake protein
LFHLLQKAAVSLTTFLAEIAEHPPLARVPGTAVFMTARHLSMPHALQRNYQLNRVLHERVVLLTIAIEDVPNLTDPERLTIDRLEQGFFRITAKHGFMETPNVPHILALCGGQGLDIDAATSTFFIGRETLIPSNKPDLAPWQEKIFLFLFRNSSSPIQFYSIPPERVMELGAQFEI